jgi:hypothetical protein
MKDEEAIDWKERFQQTSIRQGEQVPKEAMGNSWFWKVLSCVCREYEENLERGG